MTPAARAAIEWFADPQRPDRVVRTVGGTFLVGVPLLLLGLRMTKGNA